MNKSDSGSIPEKYYDAKNQKKWLLASVPVVLHTVPMRLHRFFIDEPLVGGNSIVIKNRDLLHQWKNVFRFQVGHRLILLDNSGYEFEAQISSLSGISCSLIIIESKLSPSAPSREIFLFAALIKKDKFEWVLEKGTEIGVSHFIPVLAERSEKKNLNTERALKIIKEATEQSHRAKLPKLHGALELEDALEFIKSPGVENCTVIVLDPSGSQKFDKHLFKSDKRIALFVGPEGGWSSHELDVFKKHNIDTYSLGPLVLRAETASLAATSILLL